jgi:hypothetical protein
MREALLARVRPQARLSVLAASLPVDVRFVNRECLTVTCARVKLPSLRFDYGRKLWTATTSSI